ncbi:hypothetical protein [Actinoallomurus iriomotensis]|uniref:Uncharacterized protein n=1 Tax=Actinoallomurus iriomotensis TaxID=478107 RepID=A0A9W6RUG9_9ACTN|nr:hypothetical protein [Actinoallomurus iriomotensis]GLY80342.1 hypothetical protein Airi01_086090 [Actinoallomurus iriomotensis]
MSQPLGEVDQKALLRWAFQRRSEISKILSRMPARESRTGVETLISRVSRLETNLVGGTDPIEAWDEFVEFLDGEGADAWEYYLKQQEAVDKELQEAERRKARDRLAALAARVAVKARNKYQGGPNAQVGTVIAGLVDVTTGRTWVGTSGVAAHATAAHPVMTALLDRTRDVEKWPVASCAEVDAMKQYLHANNITSLQEIPAESLFFHAETWNEEARKWQGRSACKNCSQWFTKIQAQRV